MKFKLFGGLDCPDTLLARLAVQLSPEIAAKMAEHTVNIILLFSSSYNNNNNHLLSKQETESISEFDLQNKLFFTQPEIKRLHPPTIIAQSLTAIHIIISNIIRYHINQTEAIEELTILGMDINIAKAIVLPAQENRRAIELTFLQKYTPIILFGSFVRRYNNNNINNDAAARHLIIVHEYNEFTNNNNNNNNNKKTAGFGARFAALRGNWAKQPFYVSSYKKEFMLPTSSSSLLLQKKEKENSENKEYRIESGVEWRLREGLILQISLQKAKALLAELVLARETLRHAWVPQ